MTTSWSTAGSRSGSSTKPRPRKWRLRRAVGLPDTEGLLIREAAQDSPAARAGLAPGDLIVAAAGQPVRTIDDLSAALQAAGDTIELNILRGTDERSIQVPLGQNSQPEGEA